MLSRPWGEVGGEEGEHARADVPTSLGTQAQRGYEDKPALVDAVLAAELVLPAHRTREPRGRLVMRGDVVDVFGSERARPLDWPPHWHRFRGVELAVVVDALERPVTLLVTAQGGVQFEITGELLVDGLPAVISTDSIS